MGIFYFPVMNVFMPVINNVSEPSGIEQFADLYTINVETYIVKRIFICYNSYAIAIQIKGYFYEKASKCHDFQRIHTRAEQ